MFIATGSFFLGQAKVIPKPIRVFPVLTILALLPLILMLFWLARVRLSRRSSQSSLVDPYSVIHPIGSPRIAQL